MRTSHVDVLLLNWNGWRDTIECLDSLLASDYADFRILVCDNASTDGSVERIEAWARGELHVRPTFSGPAVSGRSSSTRAGSRPPVSYVTYDRASAESSATSPDDARLVIIRTGGNLGFSAGNNVGMRYLQRRGAGDFVWLLNNDTVVAPSALSKLVARAEEDASIGAVGATVLDFAKPDEVQYFAGAAFAPWRGRIRLLGNGLPASAPRPEPLDLDYISGGCLLVRASTIESVGLLDERFFMYSEDADWCFRMREAGFRLAFAPEAEIWHKGGASSVPGSPMHDYHNLIGNLLVMQKHHPSHLPFTVVYALYRYLAPKLVRRRWRRAAAVARAFRDAARIMRTVSVSPERSVTRRATLGATATLSDRGVS
jgi:GT2 family glycosyltransferase